MNDDRFSASSVASKIMSGDKNSKKSIRVATLNTWKCDGAYPERLTGIRQQLKQADPDLVLLQEVFQSGDGRYDSLRELAEGFAGFHLVVNKGRFKQRRLKGPRIRSSSSLVIMSRYKILSHGVFSLAPAPDDAHRYCQFAAVRIGRQPVLVVNAHLTHSEQAQSIRLQQFRSISRFITGSPYPICIFGGDMNMPPVESGASDLCCVLAKPYPNTLNMDGPACVDQIYTCFRGNRFLRTRAVNVINMRSEDRLLSDHRLLMADIVWIEGR
jgi:endonuclease/exonuclease/phosphatase family metal-dependent hydrolase